MRSIFPDFISRPAWGGALEEIDRAVIGDVTTEMGTSYTFKLDDAGGWKRFTNGSAISATVLPKSAVPFVIGTVLTLEQAGAGQLTIVAGAGVTINTASTLALSAQYAVATLKKVDSDTWTIVGSLAAS